MDQEPNTPDSGKPDRRYLAECKKLEAEARDASRRWWQKHEFWAAVTPLVLALLFVGVYQPYEIENRRRELRKERLEFDIAKFETERTAISNATEQLSKALRRYSNDLLAASERLAEATNKAAKLESMVRGHEMASLDMIRHLTNLQAAISSKENEANEKTRALSQQITELLRERTNMTAIVDSFLEMSAFLNFTRLDFRVGIDSLEITKARKDTEQFNRVLVYLRDRLGAMERLAAESFAVRTNRQDILRRLNSNAEQKSLQMDKSKWPVPPDAEPPP